jgi:hypothetical protein
MTLDRELVTRKLLLITRDLEALTPYAAKSLSTFLENRIDQAVVERLLERMIGRMIGFVEQFGKLLSSDAPR